MVRRVKRSLAVAAVALLALLVGLSSVVLPQRGVAVVAVSRFGGRVGLLSSGVSVSFLPLTRRLFVPLHEGHAVIETSLDAPAPDGSHTVIPVRIELAGSGRLPINP